MSLCALTRNLKPLRINSKTYIILNDIRQLVLTATFLGHDRCNFPITSALVLTMNVQSDDELAALVSQDRCEDSDDEGCKDVVLTTETLFS
jgi:hypothetical protein